MRLRTILGWLYIVAIVGLYCSLMVLKTEGNRPAKAFAYSIAP